MAPDQARGSVLVDPDSVQQLLDLEQIKQLKARYCRFIDTKQWRRLRALFTDETRFEGLGSAPTGSDANTFVEGISTRLRDAVSIHHCHMPEIVFTGPATARGVWAMMDYLEFPEGTSPREVPGHRGFYGFGHYEEEYRKHGGEWKISFLRLTRLRIDPLADDRPASRPGLLSASEDWLSGVT